MAAWLRAMFSSLGARLLVPVFVTVGVVLAVHAVISFKSTKEHFLGFVSSEAQRSSELIRRATHDGMLLNRLNEVQATIERLAEGPEVASIRVYDKEGGIVLSSDSAEIGGHIPVDDAPCTRCHVADARTGQIGTEASDVIHGPEGEVLRRLTVIPNEPGCSRTGCHVDAAPGDVLGVLDVEMSMLPVQGALQSAKWLLMWTTAVLILLTGLVTTFVFRHLVQHPIARLQEGARRLASGDLQTRVEVHGGHELARLGNDFNRMAEDLGRAQTALSDWSQTLETRVAEKASELRSAQRQVLHMEKMASLGKLAATVAHELNNPISGMLTYTRLIEREISEQPLEEEPREELGRYLHLVQQECVRCGQIVKNMLMFARPGGAEFVAIDLNEIVDRSLMLVRHHLDISGIELRTTPLEGNSRIVADPGQVEQALVALLVNAVEAMKSGGTLTVRVCAEKGGVLLDIADTGPGIPPDVLPQIFEPFFSTKVNESGSGLGLSVVYGIVHRHGGTIEVDSEVGRGTTFHIRLRRVPPAARKDDTEEDAVPDLPPGYIEKIRRGM